MVYSQTRCCRSIGELLETSERYSHTTVVLFIADVVVVVVVRLGYIAHVVRLTIWVGLLGLGYFSF